MRKNTKKKSLSNKKNEMKPKENYNLIINDENVNEYFESSFDALDYDDVIEEDKRACCEYFIEKIKENQIIINSFIIYEPIRPKSLKIAAFILTLDLYLLINGIFFSESYISEIFNSTEKETLFSFIPRSINRFAYSIIVGNIIRYLIEFFLLKK